MLDKRAGRLVKLDDRAKQTLIRIAKLWKPTFFTHIVAHKSMLKLLISLLEIEDFQRERERESTR